MGTWFSRVKREREALNLTSTQYLVLCELGRFDGCRFGIFPSHALLASRVGCCVRTVQNALKTAQTLGLVEWVATRRRRGWRVLRGPNRYTLHIPDAPVQFGGRSTGKFCRGDSNESKKEARERANIGLAAMLEAARGLPDLLKARREAMESKFRRRLV